MFVYSLFYYLFMVVVSIALFSIAVPLFLLTWPFDRNRIALHLFSCLWGQLFYRVNPLWFLRVEGRQHLPWRGAAVLVSNHQSLGDVLILFALNRPFKWVSKASVFRVPVLGWNMRLNGYVQLVRGDRASVLKMLDACRRWLERGVPILMFPEGTRSEDGAVKAFKDGAFHLAIDNRCPVIPIVVSGIGDTLPKHGFNVKLRSNVIVRVLPPIDPAPFGSDFASLRDHVREVIVQEKARLDAELAGPAIAPA